MTSFFTELAASFGLGIAATLNPCVLPLFPGFLAFLASQAGAGGNRRFQLSAGALVLAGVLVFMSVVGLITASFQLSISSLIGTISPIAFVILIVIGVLLVFDVDLARLMPRFNSPTLNNPYFGAFVFGLFYGPIVIPCSGPLVFGVFAYSVALGGFWATYAVFLSFGLGFGIPLIIISLLSQARGKALIRGLMKHHTIINRVAGVLLISIAVYELVVAFGLFGLLS